MLAKRGYATLELLDQRRQTLDGATAALRAAKSRVDEAERAIDAATHDAEFYKVNIADNTLVAPRDGRLQYRIANIGEVLPAGGRVFTMLDISYVYMDIYLPTHEAGKVKIGSDARITLDAVPNVAIPAKVAFIATQAQFTPKTVETKDERDKLMFRMRVRIDPERLRARGEYVRSGLPGVAYVKFDPAVSWPDKLQGIVPGDRAQTFGCADRGRHTNLWRRGRARRCHDRGSGRSYGRLHRARRRRKVDALSLVAGARQIQSGSVFVLDGDIGDGAHRAAICPRIAYMPQGLGKNLYADLSVRENIEFFGRLFGQSRFERDEKIAELLESTGLAPFSDRLAKKLSGGMRQKLGLCCCLIHDPDLLILDEPTTGVDPLSRRQFWELIDRMRSRSAGMSVMVATAYMEEAERFDWLAVMSAGKVLATGTPAEIKVTAGAATLEEASSRCFPRRNAAAIKGCRYRRAASSTASRSSSPAT